MRPIAFIAVSSLVLVACGGGGDDDSADTTTTEVEVTTTAELFQEETTVPSTEPPTTPPPVETLPEFEGIPLPLTGERVDEDFPALTRPALAIKIDNNPNAQPNHSGLAVADIVFEEIVENQDTRFAAVFHSEDADPVGPIRSGRSQDIDLLLPFNQPLFGWSGGNAGVTRLVNDSSLVNLSASSNAAGYYRGPGSAPHNLFNTTADLYAQTPEGHPGAPAPYFTYLATGDEFVGDVDAELVELQMRSVPIEWRWDPEVGRYERSQEGDVHVDATYGQIYADNVVVLALDYRPSQVDVRSPEAQTIGQGRAFVFSNGQAIYGNWRREVAEFPIELFDDSGARIPLSVGNTWIELAEAVNGAPTDAWPLSLTVTPG